MRILALAVLVACQQAPDRAPEPIPVTPEPVPVPVKPKPPTPVPTKDFAKLPDELQKWMKHVSLDPWQGAWTTTLAFRATDDEKPFTIYGDDAGVPMALEITGDRGRAYDGRRDYTVELAIVSPCTVRLRADVGAPNFKQFVVVNGGARFGSGNVGYRADKNAIVCSAQFGIVTLDGGRCLRWRLDDAGKWESRELASCGWRATNGKEVLGLTAAYGSMGPGMIEAHLTAVGDVLVDYRLEADTALSAPNYDVARATIREDFVKRDPSELAKKAGGKVGDTKTVLGLIATFGADRGSVLGASVTLTGRVLEAQGSQGLILGAKANATYGVYCISSKVTVKKGDRARITGKVRQMFGMVALDECVVESAR